ncbi:glycerophosphodiester phosphodiesterase family protein [Aestuariibacter sp. A3R04]|uniref:glycerophosphodiester phosphodiesterase n=1 Tax=Aestuariibacter sp. A3R04 TaxID=2841571 RepID=UPI001C081F01|nr:glycerophosphodiester phosphodiesterase family protein [Aestuariibacter sp. A3R04]MBU3020833.1 glycerophosphodiester phosphodiesterase [Aestuariibacter sp. A3R04]
MDIFAHRGASGAAPENTLQAFTLGFAHGATGVEFDTYEVEDKIVVIHDRHLNRTTNGTGRVENATLSYLRSLNVGGGEPVPFLEEALNTVPEGKYCNIEIKAVRCVESWASIFEQACETSAMAAENVIVSSFNHPVLRKLTRLRPDLKIGLLTASYELDIPTFVKALNPWSVNVALDVVSQPLVDAIHRLGCRVFVYTVDMPEDILLMNNWGVDGIFTNYPKRATTLLAAC